MIRSLALALALATTAVSHPTEAAPNVVQLAKDRAAAAEKAFKSSLAMLQGGRGQVDFVCEWSERWMDASIAAGTKTKDALAAHVTRMTDLEAAIAKDVNAGKLRPLDLEVVQYFRIEAEYWAAGAKR
jgi:hypothetical protein